MARAVKFARNNLKRENLEPVSPQAGGVQCWRCRGLMVVMVVEGCFDFAGDGGHVDCLARRCVQCGEVVDPVILQNRRLQLGKHVARVRAER